MSQSQCTIPAPPPEVAIVSPYKSAEAYADTTRPYRSFYSQVARWVDGSTADQACAITALESWAKSGVMTAQAKSFEGERQKIRYATAANIIITKLAASGKKVSPRVVAWAQHITREETQYFLNRRGEVHGPDNLWVWSGVSAASFQMISQDPKLAAYSDRVWSDAIGGILPDGRIKRELQRAQRALNYTTYYLAALRWLEAFRSAQGKSTNAGERAAIARLERQILTSMCANPRRMSGLPDIQNPPDHLDLEAKPVYFRADFRDKLMRCGAVFKDSFAPLFGGDVTTTRRLIDARIRSR